MSDKWDDKLTERFLTLYRKHKCLWNPYSFNYRNCADKNEAFKSVIQELNRPGIGLAQCLKQIEVIRESYKKEQLKVEGKLKSGKLYYSKLPWFNLMSQMLSEVITDEEKFNKNPVGYIPCFVEKISSKNSPNEDHEAFFLPEKSPNSRLRTPFDVNRNTDTNADNLWNKCPSCGWAENKNKKSGFNDSNRFYNVTDSEIEFPTTDNGVNTSGLLPTPKTISSQLNVAKDRKKVQLNAVYRENHPCNVEKLPDIELPSKENRSNCSCWLDVGSQNNFTSIRNQRQESNKNQSLEKRPTNVQEDRNNCYVNEPESNVDSYRKTVNKKSQRSTEFEDNGSDEHNNADKYEFSSQFKITIPTSEAVDENLEITGYGIRVMTQQLSNYLLHPPCAASNVADNQNGKCDRQLCLAKKSGNFDPVRYTSIIKLRVNRKLKRSSNEFHDKKRSHTKHKKHKSENGKKDCSSEVEVPRESLPNKITQTEACCENRTIQTLYVPEICKSNSSNIICVKGCTVGQDCPVYRTPADYASSCGTNYPNEAATLTEKFGSSLINESGSSEKSQGENPAVKHMIANIPSQEKFNNTRTFLNVIVKILEADDTKESAADLQTTLNSMLDRFERISDRTAGEERNAEISGRAMNNDHSRSTQYQSFTPRDRRADDDLRVANPVLTSDHFFDLPTDETSMFALPGEVQNKVANGTRVNSGFVVEKSEVKSNEEVNKPNSPSPELSNNARNTSIASIDTNTDFENEEPIASSSRKFEERPTSSQLTKDFLNVLKYTMKMDETLNSTDYTGMFYRVDRQLGDEFYMSFVISDRLKFMQKIFTLHILVTLGNN
ncbi:uncharacterized protein LOC105690245 isoform X2 [Athalia rosae]|uniref:uncharacterized protein LOC105690245 isoform X2 n=1 Tax=Athalia rosae TaxID=37344 RepID=UPI00203392B7|nr:uncharacterized protein LOC105690245 isoform X2 [Athalia rosae]